MFDEKNEAMSLAERERLQLRRLRTSLARARKSTLYQGTTIPTKITSLADLHKIGFTTKQQLRAAYPTGAATIPVSKTSEVYFSSGSSGSPVATFFSAKDLKRSREVLARTWVCNGVKEDDVFMLLARYGLFSGGLLNHYALTRVGALVIPAGVSPAKHQVQLLREFPVTAIGSIASHYVRLIEELDRQDFTPENLRLVVAAGEPHSDRWRKWLSERLGCEVRDQYGISEVNTGLAGECEACDGLHLQSDYALPEIIDPSSGEVLSDGERGELVLTTLDREAGTLLRYRTGDITNLSSENCSCGRTTPRIGRIVQRVNETYFVKGLKIEPETLENALQRLGIAASGDWQLVIHREGGKDITTFRFGFDCDAYTISSQLNDALGFNSRVEPLSLMAPVHKHQRVLDLRSK